MSTKLSLPPCTYLYGLLPSEVTPLAAMTYVEALQFKIDLGNELAKRLLSKPYQAQDTTRINDVLKAVKFNTELIKEFS